MLARSDPRPQRLLAAGKSVALGVLAANARAVPGMQIFFMDKGYSAFVLTKALGGQHLDLGEEEAPLQPLARIDEPTDRMKGQVLLEDWIELQKVRHCRSKPARSIVPWSSSAKQDPRGARWVNAVLARGTARALSGRRPRCGAQQIDQVAIDRALMHFRNGQRTKSCASQSFWVCATTKGQANRYCQKNYKPRPLVFLSTKNRPAPLELLASHT
jgi:hypothetical protein